MTTDRISSFICCFWNLDSYYSFSVSGTVYLEKGGTLQPMIYSQEDNRFKHGGKERQKEGRQKEGKCNK